MIHLLYHTEVCSTPNGQANAPTALVEKTSTYASISDKGVLSRCIN